MLISDPSIVTLLFVVTFKVSDLKDWGGGDIVESKVTIVSILVN